MTNINASNKLYTATEAACELGVNPETVKKWHRSGKIKSVKVGERWLRFPRHEIDRLLGIESGYLRPLCPVCFSENLSWVLAAGNGMYCMDCGTTYYLTVGRSRKELEYECPSITECITGAEHVCRTDI